MRLVKPSYRIMTRLHGEDVLRKINNAARTCYKSEQEHGIEKISKV